MRSIKEFLSLDFGLFTRSNKIWLWLFIGVYAVFAVNILPVDIMLAMIVLIFLIAPVKECFFMFVFYTLWENVSVFSNGISLNFIFHIVLFAKIIMLSNGIRNGLRHKLANVVLLWMAYTFLYSIFSYISSGSLSGVNIFMKAVFVLYALSYMKEDSVNTRFWKTVFQIVAYSTLLAVVYGERYDTSLERWIVGLEGNIVFQLYGTLGTTRLGMFTVISLIYPLYYAKEKLLKIVLSALFVVLTFMTVSLSAFVLLCGLFVIYLLSKNYKWYKLVSVGCILVVVTFFVLPKLSDIDFIQPVVLRIESVKEALLSGDMNKATTGREDLNRFYIRNFERLPISEQMLGSGYVNALAQSESDTMLNSHNSYLDMSFYWGIFGAILFVFVCLKKVLYFKNSVDYYPILTLKILFLIIGFTVSMFSATFWTFFVFI